MDKRFQLSSDDPNQKSGTYLNDRISQLPEEILNSIMSFLPIKEAARTSVLSHRWKNLWTLTSHFDFGASNTKWKIKSSLKLLKMERNKYLRWVNRVVDSLKGSNLDEFIVCFDLGRYGSHYLDKWIHFAMVKRVKRLKIDLTPFVIVRRRPKHYVFPVDWCSFSRSPQGIPSIKFLVSLSLKFVNITRELVEHFLSNCPLQKELSVHSSDDLLNLKVVGSSIPLEYLEVNACSSLKNIEICAPNLVSFSYGGEEISLQVQNLQSLVDLSIGAPYGHYISYAFSPFSSYLSQLETLTLDIYLHKKNLKFAEFSELTNLKHLTVKAFVSDYDRLLGLSELIKLSPSLHKFTLELLWLGPLTIRRIEDTKCPHQCLRVLEIIGFIGQNVDIELIKFFLENAIMLETIIIDPRNPTILKRPKELRKGEQMLGARRRAEQLRAELPHGVELIIV